MTRFQHKPGTKLKLQHRRTGKVITIEIISESKFDYVARHKRRSRPFSKIDWQLYLPGLADAPRSTDIELP